MDVFSRIIAAIFFLTLFGATLSILVGTLLAERSSDNRTASTTSSTTRALEFVLCCVAIASCVANFYVPRLSSTDFVVIPILLFAFPLLVFICSRAICFAYQNAFSSYRPVTLSRPQAQQRFDRQVFIWKAIFALASSLAIAQTAWMLTT